MTNMNFIDAIISGMGDLRQFDFNTLMEHDCSLPNDYFDWQNIHHYEFNYSDMILTVTNYEKQFLQIDIDTNAFFFNSDSSPIQISTGEGTIMFYSIEKDQLLLINLNDPEVLYDPCQFMSEETNFQGTTIVDIPDALPLIEMWDIGYHMKTNCYKLRTNIPFDKWQNLPIGEYFDVCKERMSPDYDY